MPTHKLKTWVEIKKSAIRQNIAVFKKLIGPRVKLMAVVKSNAYGHGLSDFSKLADRYGVHGFCVDSVFEGERLRKDGIKKPILVLGATLPENLPLVKRRNLILTISNFDSLTAWLNSRSRPEFHLKIDTGMHRQGFFPEELPGVLQKFRISNFEIRNYLKGLYTHFASAKDVNYPSYTEEQFKKFRESVTFFEKAGFKKLITHCAASGGTLINKKYHLNMVRVGMGLYGLPPSKELGIQLSHVSLHPVLKWRTVVSEIKTIPAGSFVSYDLAERVNRESRVAILPIGYWHGFPWSLSGVGEVLIGGRSARILGRVTMDVIMVNVTDMPCKVYDVVEIDVMDSSFRAKTSHYEFLTRINPLVQRIII